MKKKYVSPQLFIAEMKGASMLMSTSYGIQRGTEANGNAEVREQDSFSGDIWGNY